MSISAFLANAELDHAYLGAALTQPSNVYVQLHTADPTDTGTAGVATETDRQEVTSFAAAASKSKSSSAQVQWTDLAATETLTHISLWDAATAGNCLDFGALDASVNVNAGGTFTIASGDLTITRQ